MRVWRWFFLVAIFAAAAILFFTGIDWGLPSRESDPFLFGNRTPWTGQQIMQLAGAWDNETSRGADIAMHPLAGRDKPVVLNDTDAKRAEIVRRYRFYSNQPDEMITFRSLSRMKPGKLDFDPAMYQYGGLWIYPVGGLLKLASALHLVTLRTDLAFYLDHPKEFGRFYIVARSYSAVWGLVGVVVVFALGRELSGQFMVGAAASAIYATMPVVIDLAHEAKPHLAGTVLTLMTVLTAAKYVRAGYRKYWIAAGVCAGASMGMVLTGYVAFAVLPVMALLRSNNWQKRLQIMISSVLFATAVFVLTNPYLPFNFLFHRQVLHSNVGNYGTFYQPTVSIAGLRVTLRSLLDGMSIAPMILGLISTSLAIPTVRARQIILLPAAVALVVLIQLILLAEGKTAEYARFGVTLDVVLAIAAAWAISLLPISTRGKSLAAMLLVAGTLFFGLRYDINFLLDSRADSTRMQAAIHLEKSNAPVIAIWAEPAPYCTPPINLFDRQIVLEPRGSDASALMPAAIGVRAVDYPKAADTLAPARVVSPISWANKPFEIINPPSVSTITTRP